MSKKFAVQTALPATGDRQDLYDTMESMAPTSELVDASGLKVQNEKIAITAGVPRWEKYTINFGDFTLAGLAQSLTLLSLPASGVVERVVIHVTTAWVIAGMSTLDLAVGILGTLGKYTASGHANGEALGVTGFAPVSALAPESMSSATNILVTATSNAGNLSTATAGSAAIYVLRSDLINL